MKGGSGDQEEVFNGDNESYGNRRSSLPSADGVHRKSLLWGESRVKTSDLTQFERHTDEDGEVGLPPVVELAEGGGKDEVVDGNEVGASHTSFQSVAHECCQMLDGRYAVVRNDRRLRTEPMLNPHTDTAPSFFSKLLATFSRSSSVVSESDAMLSRVPSLTSSGSLSFAGSQTSEKNSALSSVKENFKERRGKGIDEVSMKGSISGQSTWSGFSEMRTLVVYDTGGVSIEAESIQRNGGQSSHEVGGTVGGSFSFSRTAASGPTGRSEAPGRATTQSGYVNDLRRSSGEGSGLMLSIGSHGIRYNRPRFFYYGQTRRNRRHGWGMLVNDERLLFEGQWKSDVVLGWYICYHDYATEFGYRELNDVCAVSVASDSDYFIVPVASNAYASTPPSAVVRNNRKSCTVVTRPADVNVNIGKEIEPGEVSAKAMLSQVRRGKHRSKTIHSATAFTITVEAPSDDDSGGHPSAASTTLARAHLPTLRESCRLGGPEISAAAAAAAAVSAAAAQAAREMEDADNSDASGESFLVAQPAHPFNGRSSGDSVLDCSSVGSTFADVSPNADTVLISNVMGPTNRPCRRGHWRRGPIRFDEHEGLRSNRRNATCVDGGANAAIAAAAMAASGEGSEYLEEAAAVAAEEGIVTAAAVAAAEAEILAAKRRFFRRGATFPESTTQENLAAEETPLCEGMTRGGSKRNALSVAAGVQQRLRASDCHKWSSITLAQFLRMIGMSKEAAAFKLNKVCGADIPSLKHSDMEAIGISDPYVIRFILCVFRYLWSCTDHRDPLMPQNRRHLQKGRQMVPIISSSEVVVGPCIGGGGYATVHKAKYMGNAVACKIFKYNPKPTAVAAALTNKPWESRALSGEIRSFPHSPCSTSSRSSFSMPVDGDTSFSTGGRGGVLCSGNKDVSADSFAGKFKTGDDECSKQINNLAADNHVAEIRKMSGEYSKGDGISKRIESSLLLTTPPVSKNINSLENSRVTSSSEGTIDQLTWEWRYGRLLNVDFFRYCPVPVKHRDLEADILASLQGHPSIIKLIGKCSLKPGEEALLVELCARGSMDSLVFPPERDRTGRRYWRGLSRPRLVNLFEQVAGGMAYVHEKRVLHRDIKLSNFLVHEKTAKIADFGVATVFVDSDSPSVLSLYGNVFYAAPEVLRGEGYYPASDVWSFGVAFWEALTGRIAYDGECAGYVHAHVAAGELSLKMPSDLPLALQSLLRQTLLHNHHMRPSFVEIQERLQQMQAAVSSAMEQNLDEFFGL